MYRNQLRRRYLRFIIISVICAVAVTVCAAMAVHVFAQEISVTVEDWDNTYSFSMGSLGRDSLKRILSQAESLGLEPLGPDDTAELGEDSRSVLVRRGVALYVKDRDETKEYVAYKGDTIEASLLRNGFVLKDTDRVEPNREMTISADLTVEIKRLLRVNIAADGEINQVQMSSGTVADALEQAGIRLGELDKCSHELDEPVKDDMLVEVTRMISVRIAADGSTRAYRVSALTVEEALEKCKIQLGKEDRVTPLPETLLKSGTKITVQRVETVEETETEEIDYETKYLHTRDLVEGESSVLTEGIKGKKEKVYQAVYVDGVMESRKLLSEKVTAEPVKKIVLRGSGYQNKAPQLEFIDDGTTPAPGSTPEPGAGNTNKPGISVNTTAGTIKDEDGQEVKYTRAITGECTAYCIPGGTTSIGLEAVRGVIAVDPDVIPYGTRMFVASPDGKIVYGYGVAGDTGGACLDGDILADLCYDTLEECSIIGRRDMVLYILE